MKRRSRRRAPSAAALKTRLRELELVIEGLYEGVYDWNIATGEMTYSDRDEVLGFPTDSFRRVADWAERIHPEDREKYRLANIAHFKGITPRFLCEYRYRAPDGSWRWARTHGMAVRDRKGRAVRVVGSTGDITDRKRAEEALRASEERYAMATSVAVEGIYEWDVATGALYLTERAKEFFSFPAEALTPAGWTERVHADDREAYKQAIVDHFKGRAPHLEHEYRITDNRGGWRWILDRGTGVRDAGGRVIKVVGALSDITRRKRMAETVHLLSRLEPDVQPVLDTIARNAVELCGGGFGVVFRVEDERLHLAATHNFTPAASAALQKKFPMRPDRSQLAGRAALTGEVQRIEEVLTDPEYDQAVARGAGWRRGLAVPLLHETRTLGVIAVSWTEPGEIPEWQIDLLQSLAAQAVIALENARLYKETREALEAQTVTAEVPRVMLRSFGSVQPVFDAIAKAAVRLCDAAHCSLYQLEDGLQRPVAHYGLGPEMIAHLEERYRRAPNPGTVTGHAILRREVVNVADTLADQSFPESHATQRLAGDRAVLAVPMLKDEQPVGAILVGRRDPRPFSARHVELLRTFADQAVIAVENVRLFNETREALDRQTATAEILTVMSNSTIDVQPVFDAIVKNVQQLFGTRFAVLQLVRDGQLVLVAYDGQSGFEKVTQEFPRPASGDSIAAKAIRARATVQLAPIIDNPAAPERSQRMARTLGYNALIATPLVRAEGVIGAIVTGHGDGRPFSDKQAALLKAFADQAVIAIENVRLFNETREALQQQKALAEVLGAISGALADTKPVFDKILDTCEHLFEGHLVGLTLAGGDGKVYLGAYKGDNKEAMERIYPMPLSRESGTGCCILDRKVVRFADVGAPGSDAPPQVIRGGQTIGFKSIIFAPLIAEGRGIGALWVARRSPARFSDKQSTLLETFADQAAIAVENARLFRETRESLEGQTATADVLRVMSRSPGNVQPVFDAIAKAAVRLCEGVHCTLYQIEGGQQHFVAHHGVEAEMLADLRAIYPRAPRAGTVTGLAILERSIVNVEDCLADARFPESLENHRRGGYRAVIAAPMLKDEQPIGVIFIGRRDARPFSGRQIELLRTFAAQAAIAIEHVRLFKHKSEFLAHMSHELRTPLNAIIGFTRVVMRRSQQLEPKQYENLEKILGSGERLLGLINSVLDLSKIDAGRLDVHPGEVSLAALLEQSLRMVEPLVRSEVTLERDFHEDLPRMVVDEEKLRQIVINLLSNALKFTERGAVRLAARVVDGQVAISVADTGVGIPADKLDLIFDEFEQADAGRARGYGGTGLGLTIARRLARLMGGEIEVESALGAGATFRLTLPLRYAETERALG